MPRRKQDCPKRMKYEAGKEGENERHERNGDEEAVTDSGGNNDDQSDTEDEMTEGEEEEETKDGNMSNKDSTEETCEDAEQPELKLEKPKMFKSNAESEIKNVITKEHEEERELVSVVETTGDSEKDGDSKKEGPPEKDVQSLKSSSLVSSVFPASSTISKLESMSKSHLEKRDVSLVGLMSQHLLPVASSLGGIKNLPDSSSPLSKLQDIVMSTTPRHLPRKPQVSALSKFYADSLKPRAFLTEQHRQRSPLKQPSPPKSPVALSVPTISHLIGQPMVHLSNFDSDQPLDLSCKKKRSISPESSRERVRKRLAAGDYTVPLSPNASTAPDSSSCLASLEQKFGGNSYLLDGVGLKPRPPPRRPFISSLGGTLYTTALYGSPMALQHPSRYLPIQPKSEPLQYLKSPEAHMVKRSVNSTRNSQMTKSTTSHSHSHNHSHSHSHHSHSPGHSHSHTNQNHSPSHSSAARTLTSAPDRERDDAAGPSPREKSHTNLACVCGKDFETLYDLTIHLQDTGHPPANSKAACMGDYPKLVRGQDMWLNQGSEQTRQILRCMQCGESFKSLPELTVHMIDTKHYTNIVGSEPSKKLPRPSLTLDHDSENGENVFKCKVCMSDFESMNDLATHMVSTGHHKKQKSMSGVRSPSSASYQGNSDRGCESPLTLRNSPRPCVSSPFAYPSSENCDTEDDMDIDLDDACMMSDSKICCENCGEKIDTYCFVEHVRQCVKARPYDSPSRKRDSDHSRRPPPEVKDHNVLHYRDNAEDKKAQSNSFVHSSSPSVNATKATTTVKQEPDSSDMAAIHSSTDFLIKSRRRSVSPISDAAAHSSLIPPLPSSSDRSALKAMESFIERSFIVPTRQKHNFLDASSFRDIIASNDAYPHSLDSPSGRSTPDDEQSNIPGLYENKYLPPLYEGPVMSNRKEPVSEERNGLSPGSASPKVDDTEQPREEEEPQDEEKKTLTIKTEITDDSKPEDKSPPPRSPNNREDKSPVRESEPADNSEKNKSSALESLQGLVYGKSFNTEHPLDSLQKLIHTTHGVHLPERPNGSQTVVTGKATLQPGMPGTVILVNPIVTVLPNSSAPASVHISMPRDSYSPNETNSKDFDFGSGNDSDSEAPADLLCRACKRTFASKGSYRYHLSRCHMSSAAKKCAIKEMINTTPYIYLPLDHSAKFSKYYEMANELANKGK